MDVFTCSKHNYSGLGSPCPDCARENNIEILKEKFNEFAKSQKSIPEDIQKIINEKFWDLL